MSSDSCDTSAELSDEQVVRALKAVGKGMKPSLATTFLSRGSKSLTSLITKIISSAVLHLEESAFTEDGLNILEEMRSKTEFAAALLASLDNIEQTLMTRPHWEKIPQILASIYHRWSTVEGVEGVQALIFDILVKWVGVDVKKDDENVNLFNCKTWENFCDDKELKFCQVDCAESLLTVIGQNLFENNPDSFEALYNEIRSHLLKEDCDVRDKLLRMLMSMTLISGGIFEHRNVSKKQTAPKIQHESGTNSEGPSITAREVVDKYLSDWNAIQNDEFIYETIEHDETDDEESGRMHSRTSAENNPLIEDICETEFDNASQTRIDLVSPSHFETVECESTQFTIAETENEIVQNEKEEPHRIEKTVTANRFNLKQNQVAMESSPSDYSSDEDFVEITHYVPEKSGRKVNFRRNANNFMSNHGDLNQTDEVKNPKFAEARAEEIFQHGRCDKLGGKASSLEKKSFDSNSEVTMDMAKLKLKSDQPQVGNALKYPQTTSGGTQASQQNSSCEALGYLVQVVTETAVARELMHRNNYPVTDGAIIGRTSQCDVVVSCKTVSRTQARIYREGEQVFFETMSKTNASLVNNIPVHCHSGPIRINNGYTIQVGEVLFVWKEVGRCFEHQNDEGKSLIDKGDISGLRDTNACIKQSNQEDVKAGASPVIAISDYKHIPRAEDVVHLAQKANLGVAGRDKESKLGRASRGRKTVAARLEADVKRCWKQSADGTFGQDTGDDTTADKNSTKDNRCDKTVSNAIPNTIIDASTFHNAFSNEDLHDNHNESFNTSLPHAHNISFENKFLNVYQHKRKALKIPKRVPDVNICRDGGRKSARIRSGRRQCVVNAVPNGRRGTDRQLMIISRHYVEKDQVFSAQ